MLPNGESGHYMVVSKELREKAGVGLGNTVEVSIELGEVPREIELSPEDEKPGTPASAAGKQPEYREYSC